MVVRLLLLIVVLFGGAPPVVAAPTCHAPMAVGAAVHRHADRAPEERHPSDAVHVCAGCALPADRSAMPVRGLVRAGAVQARRIAALDLRGATPPALPPPRG